VFISALCRIYNERKLKTISSKSLLICSRNACSCLSNLCRYVTSLQCTLRECEMLRSLRSHEFACYLSTQESCICNLDGRVIIFHGVIFLKGNSIDASSCSYLKHNVSENGFCLRLQVEPTQLGPIARASPYLRTPAPTQDRVYKPSTAETIRES
jgi:hypothetical protein